MGKKTVRKTVRKTNKRKLRGKKTLGKTHRKNKQSGGNGFYLNLSDSVSLGKPVVQGYSECSS